MTHLVLTALIAFALAAVAVNGCLIAITIVVFVRLRSAIPQRPYRFPGA